MTVFRALVGKSRPILHTALGRAILAVANPLKLGLLVPGLYHQHLRLGAQLVRSKPS